MGRRFLLLAATGCTLFQVAGGCDSQLLSSLSASLVPVLTSVVTKTIISTLLGGIAT